MMVLLPGCFKGIIRIALKINSIGNVKSPYRCNDKGFYYVALNNINRQRKTLHHPHKECFYDRKGVIFYRLLDQKL